MNLFKANVYRNKSSPMKPRNGKRWNYVKTNRKNYMVVVYINVGKWREKNESMNEI